MFLNFLFITDIKLFLLLPICITAVQSLYRIGAGIADITGPPAGVTFVRNKYKLKDNFTFCIISIEKKLNFLYILKKQICS